MVELSVNDIKLLIQQVLSKAKYSDVHIDAIQDVILKGQIDGCESHGLYRLLNCIHSVESEKVSATAIPTFHYMSPVVIKVDAHGAMAPLALQQYVPKLIEDAKKFGIAILAINNCVHFSALWYEIEMITNAGLVGLACTSNHAWVAPFGGKRPLLGTNPIAFGWPRPNNNPYVFDFATTVVARGEIELHLRKNSSVPEGWGVNEYGHSTTSPFDILKKGAMLTFGEHKGTALATMVELLSGPLIGDLLSTEALEFDEDTHSSPLGGELIIAISPEIILSTQYNTHMHRAEKLFEAYEQQNVRLPSQRRYKNRKEALNSNLLQVKKSLYEELLAYLNQ